MENDAKLRGSRENSKLGKKIEVILRQDDGLSFFSMKPFKRSQRVLAMGLWREMIARCFGRGIILFS